MNTFNAPFGMTFDEFITSTLDVQTLNRIFHSHYLRSADDENRLRERDEFARRWYNHFSEY